MMRFASESQVVGGYYLNTSSWSIHAVEGRKGFLPGAQGTQWVRLATPLMIVAAAALSLGFVIFLPTIAIGLFLWVVAKAAVNGVERLVATLSHTLAPKWVPGEAYLARREEKPAEPKNEALEQLSAEVEARADEEKKNARG